METKVIYSEGENLKKEDYKKGFTLDSSLYYKILKTRKDRKIPNKLNYTRVYDIREGYYITGDKINTKKHKYHNFSLYDKKKDFYLNIDVVKIDYSYGLYLTLNVREVDSRSHKILTFENINSRDEDIISEIKLNTKRYKLVPKITYIKKERHIFDFLKKNYHLFKYNVIKDEFKTKKGIVKLKSNKVFLNNSIILEIKKYDDLLKLKDIIIG